MLPVECLVGDMSKTPNRADGRLFFSRPPDRFPTRREAELAGREHSPVASDRDGWEGVPDHPDGDAPEPERHYWQMHRRPVETPDGLTLGTALFVTEFPQLPPDFDDYVTEFGMDDSIYPTQARTLKMADLASDEDARKFKAEFRSYLVRKVLERPELAPEGAKLEGLPGTWAELDYWGIVDFMSSRTLVREAEN
jgi:hypothetical protein